MPPTSRSITLPDGRHLDVLVGGATDGPGLVLHHGTPGDATMWSDWDEVARAHGLRLIALSRPGYATSTRRPGRSVADVATDVEHVLAAFDVSWFVTAGWSGGGPHALACAALLPDRCRAAATLAGVAPFGRADLDFLDGMGPENIAEFGAATLGEPGLRAWLAENAASMQRVTGPELAAAFGGLVPQADKDVLVGDFAEHLAKQYRRALQAGYDGWIDDDFAFIRPWGFDESSTRIPITIWQGDLDLMVPLAHGRWLEAHVPTGKFEFAVGHGHLSFIAGAKDEIVSRLVVQARDDVQTPNTAR